MPARVAPNTTAKSMRPSRKLLSPKKRTACTHTSLPRARAAHIIPTGRRGERSIGLASRAPMSFVWSTLIVVLVSGLAAGVLLLVRRRAPAGSVFEDGDRASGRSEEHTSELQSLTNLVCRLLLEKKKKKQNRSHSRQQQKNNQK